MITTDEVAQSTDEMRILNAEQLRRHMFVTNMGLIKDIKRSGVFVVAKVRGRKWFLSDGTGNAADEEVVWHVADQVVVEDVEP